MSYAELHAKSNFSFLEGASHPEELVERAAELGYAALALTDRNSLAGVVRAHTAAKDIGFKLLIGAEITLADAPAAVLLATDRPAYARLSRLITRGRRQAPKGECQLRFADVAEFAEGVIACVLPRSSDGTLTRSVGRYRDAFGDRCYLCVELHRGAADALRVEQWKRLARQARVPLVAAGDVHYHVASRFALQQVLTATRYGVPVATAGERLFRNAQRHLHSLEEIRATFAAVPDAVRRTVEIADRCTFSLDELRYDYPRELAPAGQTPAAYLERLTWQGARQRYPDGIPSRVRHLLEHELRLIRQLRYEAYFLTIYDLVRFARRRGILCQGRGSAANSAVCYCLGITSVDPARMDVLFERFISRERDEAPDIDVDFEHERREEVLQYLYAKYGRQRAAMTAEVIRYRSRSAVRDVGKALGLSADRIDTLAKNLEGHGYDDKLRERCRLSGIDPDSRLGRQLTTLVEQLIGFPRHRSQHVGGMVVTNSPLCELVPIENAAMPGRTVIEWDKDDLDALGMLKIDCLALGMLTAIRKSFALVRRHVGRELTLDNVPQEDGEVYDMICRADTVGVFQIESRAQMSMLPRLKPRTWYDLVIQVAIVRPGPIQGDMVHPYLRRRNGEEPVSYPNEAIREVLSKTLGVPLFQEQAMRLAMVAAGFSAGEADQLRRAMGAWRRPGVIHRFRQRLLDGMQRQGLPAEFAERVFQQIQGFGEYGFPESHAASFALLVYVSAWLKYHYPAAFTAALLNSQPMGFYAPAQLIASARRSGVPVRPVDINHSCWDTTLEASGCEESPWALRLGFRLISGLPVVVAEAIERNRTEPYRSVGDLARRAGLSRASLERLARADAFGSLGLSRREALWYALEWGRSDRGRPLLNGIPEQPEEEIAAVQLPAMTEQREVVEDYRTLGLTLRTHPVTFHRPMLRELGVVAAEQLADHPVDRPVRVAGLVLLRQRPSTAKGITFVTLEDETGTVNLVIHQRVWDRYYLAARRATLMLAYGRLERREGVIHVVVNYLADLATQIESAERAEVRSRDFH